MNALSVEEAMALSVARRSSWLRCGFSVKGGVRHPTYQCGACHSQFVTLVTPGAVLPPECPKCGVALTAPH